MTRRVGIGTQALAITSKALNHVKQHMNILGLIYDKTHNTSLTGGRSRLKRIWGVKKDFVFE